MNLQRLNNFLTKGMIGVFASILPFSILSLVFPIVAYLLSVILIVLMILTVGNFVLTTYLFIKQIINILNFFQKQYEQQSAE